MELRAMKWTKLVLWNVSKVQGLLKLSLWEKETPGQMFNVSPVYFSWQDTSGTILSSLSSKVRSRFLLLKTPKQKVKLDDWLYKAWNSVHPCPTSQQQSVWIPLQQWGQFSPKSDHDRDLNVNRTFEMSKGRTAYCTCYMQVKNIYY